MTLLDPVNMMMATSSSSVYAGQRTLSVILCNMHGFNSGSPMVTELVMRHRPDTVLFQEHWLVLKSNTPIPML